MKFEKKHKVVTAAGIIALSATAVAGVAFFGQSECAINAAVGETVTIGEGTYASVYETGFESATAETLYTEEKSYTADDCDGVSWKVNPGAVSETGKITGSNSMHMRLYSNGVKPYLMSTSSVQNVSALKFTYAVSNKNVKFDVQVSDDKGETWTTAKSVSPSGTAAATVAVELSAAVEDFRVKFVATAGNPSSTSTKYQWRIDDIVFGSVIEDSAVTALSVTPTSKEYVLGSALAADPYTVSITKDGAAGTSSDYYVEIGKKEGSTFTKRASVVWGTTKVLENDNALRFASKYPTAVGGETYLESFVDLSWTYATLTSFSVPATLSVDSGKTVTITPTVSDYANPKATYASSDESIATVDASTGVVTGVKGGTVTITATSLGKNAAGESMVGTTTVNVSSAPIYEKDFVGTAATGFASQTTATEETVTDTKEFVAGYPLTLTATPATSARVIAPAANGQQFGTTNNPYSSINIKSANFGNIQVTKVTVILKGASSGSAYSVGVTVGGTAYTCASGTSGSKDTTTTFEFTGSSYGAVSITIDNITAGINLRHITVYGDADTSSNVAKANAFARSCELENACDGAHTELFAAYGALDAEVKAIADAIVISDWTNGDTAHSKARTATMTVAAKMAALEAATTSSVRTLGSMMNQDNAFIALIIGVSGITAVGGFFLLRKKHN